MNQLAFITVSRAPALVAASRARRRIPRSSPHPALAPLIASSNSSRGKSGTRRRAAPMRACPSKSFGWLAARGATQLAAIENVHVADYIEESQRERSASTAKLRLATLRHLFDWMVNSQIIPTDPTAAVRGPRHTRGQGKALALDPAEARQLLDAIETSTVTALRDCALIGLMFYSSARVGAAIDLCDEDVYTQNRRLWVRLHEKGGELHAMQRHHNLKSFLPEYIDRVGLPDNAKALLFET